MNHKLTLLTERRQALIKQSEAQRLDIAKNMHPWRKPLALADKGLTGIQYLKKNPVLTIGASTLLAMLRPKGATKWLQSGWRALQITRSIINWLSR